jgi:branched-chain amino acid transport system ATP-binding protein
MAESWNENPVLTVEHLTMRFGGLVAVDDVSFSVGRTDITALIGPNGAGKTTVFNCLTGFYKPTEGRITLRNGDRQFLLERMDDFRISSTAKVARTFQNIRLFGGMTLLENLMISQHNYLMRASGYTLAGIFGLRSYKKAEKAAIDKSKYWLDKVGLTDRADDPAGDLPYGAQRRLEIARAMCTDPVLLCLDEPAAGLNPRESEELNRLLRYIRETHKIGILLIEHDMSVVMGISDHVVVLDYGQKLSDGTATAVRTDPAVIRAYLGVDEEELEVAAKQGDEAIKAIVRDVKAVEAGKPAKSGRAKGNKP